METGRERVKNEKSVKLFFVNLPLDEGEETRKVSRCLTSHLPLLFLSSKVDVGGSKVCRGGGKVCSFYTFKIPWLVLTSSLDYQINRSLSFTG